VSDSPPCCVCLLRNPWEGINLLPFIDIALLKEVTAKYCPVEKLDVNERVRNSRGNVYCYKYDITCSDIVESPDVKLGLQEIARSHSSVGVVKEQESAAIFFEPVLIDGTQIPYPGFPSLNVLPIASVELTNVGLNCFGSPSKYLNMVFSLHVMPELVPIEVLADSVLGQSIFVNWPMMHEARAVAISNGVKEIRLLNNKRKVTIYNMADSDRWVLDSQAMFEMYHTGNGVPGSGGVNIGDVKVRLKVLPLQGMRTNPSNGATKKLFGRQEADVPLQLCLLHAAAPDPRFVERGPITLEDRFPPNLNVVLTKGKYCGCMGVVVGVADHKCVAVNVDVMPPEPPFGLAVARSVQETYMTAQQAARVLKIHPGVFGKIVGRLQFEQDRYDLGLNLKSADGLCVVGYTRKKIETTGGKTQMKAKRNAWVAGDSLLVIGSPGAVDEESNQERIQWEYTPDAVRLVDTYRKKFPRLFSEIIKNPNEKTYDANKVFGPNGEKWLPVVRAWLNADKSAKLPRTPVTTESMSYEAVRAVETAAGDRARILKERGYPKRSLIKIPGSAIYGECSTGATDVLLASDLNSGEAPQLGDRIVNLCADGIPFGARGTVIGIHEAASTGCVEVAMDEEFMGGTSLQGLCSNFRGKLCAWTNVLKVSPDDSEKLVEKIVPKGSRRAAIDKIVSESDVVATAGLVLSSGGTTTTSAAKPDRQTSSSGTKPRAASRSGSTGRGKLILSREARGPDGEGFGFQGKGQQGANGFARWKAIVGKVQKPASESGTVAGASSADVLLKSMLGLTPVPVPMGSKEFLGVAPPVASTRSAPSINVDEGANAMLGVGRRVVGHMDSADLYSAPTSVADKLLQLMASKQPMAHPMVSAQMPQVPGRSGFNFTYVEEGKEPPPQMIFSAPSMQHPMVQLNFPIGIAGAPYFGGVPPPMHSMAMMSSVSQAFPALSIGQSNDFPPLGTPPPVFKQEAPDIRKAKPVVQADVMVPSVVAAKARR
jgi:5'-3' exoribonuclease 1